MILQSFLGTTISSVFAAIRNSLARNGEQLSGIRDLYARLLELIPQTIPNALRGMKPRTAHDVSTTSDPPATKTIRGPIGFCRVVIPCDEVDGQPCLRATSLIHGVCPSSSYHDFAPPPSFPDNSHTTTTLPPPYDPMTGRPSFELALAIRAAFTLLCIWILSLGYRATVRRLSRDTEVHRSDTPQNEHASKLVRDVLPTEPPIRRYLNSPAFHATQQGRMRIGSSPGTQRHARSAIQVKGEPNVANAAQHQAEERSVSTMQGGGRAKRRRIRAGKQVKARREKWLAKQVKLDINTATGSKVADESYPSPSPIAPTVCDKHEPHTPRQQCSAKAPHYSRLIRPRSGAKVKERKERARARDATLAAAALGSPSAQPATGSVHP
ncbi:hypothetical protein BDW22DRAFT_1359712 [Trametopsis cervina]|nr:hypothetical protein BDW22DRAFT_1359712 [Trametopsis cervina]